MTPSEQAQLRIHKILSEEPGISQRQLAVRLGIGPGQDQLPAQGPAGEGAD